MRSRTTNRQRGFTLGETLTALAVAGIGLTLAVPGLQAFSRDNGQAVAINQLVGTMHMARSEAVMRNARVAVCASAGGERCDGQSWSDGWIAFLDSDGNLERSSAEALVDRVPAPGMVLVSAQFATGFSYAADGHASNATGDTHAGEFAFCEAGADNAARVVILRASGLPTLAARGRDGAVVRCPAGPEA